MGERACGSLWAEGEGVRVPGGGGERVLRALAAVLGALASLAGVGALVVTGTAGASTSDPPSNIYPNPPFFENCSSTSFDNSALCVNQTVEAIDNARSQEGVGAMTLPSNWYALTATEQLYVATNLERTARGLPPLSAMATRLDQAAQQGANQGQDAMMPSDFPAGAWTSNWAGGSGNPLENIYFWMYYDGPGSNNVNCQSAGQSGCWIHRHNILVGLRCQPCVMGTGYSATGWNGGTSWTEMLADDTAGSPPADYSWSQDTPYLPAAEAGSGSSGGSYAAPSASPNSSASTASAGGGGQGHRMVEATGGVFDFGGDRYYGSLPGLGINVDDIVGMVPTADNGGYWLVGSDGGVFAFGDAGYVGSVPGTGNHVNDIVGIAPTSDGRGYWMVGSDGGIFSFGDAVYRGSVPGSGRQVSDIVGIARTYDGGGYWLIGRYGDLWSFGDAPYLGSPWGSGDAVSNIVAIASGPAGGYWIIGSDGGVFGYGPARYYGSVPGAGAHVNDIVNVAPTPDGGGYWMYGSDGGVFSFGDAPYFGSLPGLGIHVCDIRWGTST